jgi:hypothetical protein
MGGNTVPDWGCQAGTKIHKISGKRGSEVDSIRFECRSAASDPPQSTNYIPPTTPVAPYNTPSSEPAPYVPPVVVPPVVAPPAQLPQSTPDVAPTDLSKPPPSSSETTQKPIDSVQIPLQGPSNGETKEPAVLPPKTSNVGSVDNKIPTVEPDNQNTMKYVLLFLFIVLIFVSIIGGIVYYRKNKVAASAVNKFMPEL